MSVRFPYTPLESLLLLQSLRVNGVDNINFGSISEQIKAIPSVRDAPSYDDTRLRPEALRELYLQLVKEEVRYDLEHRRDEEAHRQNGALSPGARKRKLPSPPAQQTLQDAAQYKHLIPRLVTRLYTRYRESAVVQIRDCEHRYSQLVRTQNGVHRPINPSRSEEPSFSNPQQRQPISEDYHSNAVRHKSDDGDRPPISVRESPSNPILSTDTARTPDDTRHNVPSDLPLRTQPTLVSQAELKQADSTPSPILDTRQDLTASNASSPSDSVPTRVSNTTDTKPPRLSVPALDARREGPASTSTSFSESPSISRTNRSPSMQPTSIKGQTSSSPALLHASRHTTPSHSLGTQSSNARQRHAYTDQRPVHTMQQKPSAQTYATQPPHAGGYQLQPFYLDSPSQPPIRPSHSIRNQSTPQAVVRSGVPYASPAPAHASNTGPRLHPNPQLLNHIVAALATPPRSQRRPLWKSERSFSPHTSFSVPSRPQIEPLSPTLGRARSPPTRKLGRNQLRATQSFTDNIRSSSIRQPAGEKSPSGDSRLMPSTWEDSKRKILRSHSVSSTAGPGSAADEHELQRMVIKDEPATPADEPELHDSQSTVTAPRTRKRRGTVQSSSVNKRRREISPSTTANDASPRAMTPSLPVQTMLATRNFAKLSSTLMNDINSHKHASYFAGPVRIRDAEGYNDIIKQPQHLKSIRAAISAGSRAVAAASIIDSPDEISASASSRSLNDGSATVEIERTEDFTAPRIIVNGVQLEKEIMRMFANAVMFNPGEDGLVADTREMFEDVEIKIREWRGVERDAMGEDDDDGKSNKRRKL